MSDAPLSTLVVDDVEGLRRLVTMVLENSDRYEVAGEAADGEEALSLVEELHPDVVLLDLSMPGMDGFEVLRRMVEMAPDTKVIVLSGHEEAAMRDKAIEGGAVGYVEKGLTPEDLVADIDALLDGE